MVLMESCRLLYIKYERILVMYEKEIVFCQHKNNAKSIIT